MNREFDALADDFMTLGLLPPGSDKSTIVPALTGVFQALPCHPLPWPAVFSLFPLVARATRSCATGGITLGPLCCTVAA